MDFITACVEAATMKDFVDNYNRITGSNFSLGENRTVFEKMIDDAAGYSGINKEEAFKFADFFYEYVWSRLPNECFTQ